MQTSKRTPSKSSNDQTFDERSQLFPNLQIRKSHLTPVYPNLQS
jgi:hypothetical protein